jgi:hypothetical protein
MTSNTRKVVRRQLLAPLDVSRANAWVEAARRDNRAQSQDSSSTQAGPVFSGRETPTWLRSYLLFGQWESEKPHTFPLEGEWLEQLQQFQAGIGIYSASKKEVPAWFEAARQEAYARSAGRGEETEAAYAALEARCALEAEAEIRQQQDLAEAAQTEEDFDSGQSDYSQLSALHHLQTWRPQPAPRESDSDNLAYRFQSSWLVTHTHPDLPLNVLEAWLAKVEEAPETRVAAELDAARRRPAGPAPDNTDYDWNEVDREDEGLYLALYLSSSTSVGELEQLLREELRLSQSETCAASDHDDAHANPRNSNGAAQYANGQDAQPASTDRQKLPEDDRGDRTWDEDVMLKFPSPGSSADGDGLWKSWGCR